MPSEAYRRNFAEIDWSVPFITTTQTERTPPARSHLPAPMVIGDSVEIKSMVDGKIYTSKSALRKSYRERGYVEVGNEKLTPAPKPAPDRKAIREAVGKAMSRVGIPA